MTTVTIPASVTTIGQMAFDTSLTTVFFLGAAPTITAAGTYGSFGFYPDKVLYYLYANAASFGSVVWRGYSIAVLGTPFTTTITPSISGTAKVGQTLTAYMSQWWTWSPIPTSVSYAWTRSGSAEVLGTDETYQPTVADVGSTFVNLSTVTANAASGEVRFAEPTSLSVRYYSALAIAKDGDDAEPVFIFRYMPMVALTDTSDQTWDMADTLPPKVTMTPFRDDTAGFAVEHAFGGLGWKNIAAKAGFAAAP